MYCKYSRASLVRIYRSYARKVGWNDHRMIAEQKVELWFLGGSGSIDAAIEAYEQTRKRKATVRMRIVLCMVSLLSAAGLIAVYLESLVCEWRFHSPWGQHRVWAVAANGSARLSFAELECNLKIVVGLFLVSAFVSARALLKAEHPGARPKMQADACGS